MHDEPGKLLVPNPINRYLFNSPMLPQLRKDKDGGLTLYLQAGSPGKEKWLPAPKGPFFAVLRIYWPKQPTSGGLFFVWGDSFCRPTGKVLQSGKCPDVC